MSLKTAHELPAGGIITEAGNSAAYNTGDWRTLKPEFVAENCIHCMFCWIYCPDSAVLIDASGEKTKMIGFDFDHCKGCGICAQECPPKAKGKAAIVMVPDKK
jgi:pyruvate ferredoxin oxidoreductase delta subunit